MPNFIVLSRSGYQHAVPSSLAVATAVDCLRQHHREAAFELRARQIARQPPLKLLVVDREQAVCEHDAIDARVEFAAVRGADGERDELVVDRLRDRNEIRRAVLICEERDVSYYV